ncbi:MAG: hypothetical protein AAF572_25185 [Cyanobacteria bacterium P01_B01_bin.77]
MTVYFPRPANNSFSGRVIHVEFRPNGVTDVSDSNGNRSLNQQNVPDTLTLELQRDNTTTQVLTIHVTR